MLVYILKSTFCLVLLLGIYHLFLEKEKMHTFNRFYLLGSILFSFLVPSFTITVSPTIIETPVLKEAISLHQLSIDAMPQQQINEAKDYTKHIISLYVLISSILLILLSKKIHNLLNKAKQNRHINYFSATVVLLKERIIPYTFLHYIFINKHTYQTETIEEQILTHELAHVEQKHSIDVLFIEVLQNLFWFNPIFRYYKKAIQLNHEFLADDAVINSHKNISEYQQVLLNTTAQNNNIYLASNLNYSLTKKRLLMMTTPSSRTKILLKKILILPLIVGFTFAFAQRVEAQQKNNKPQVVEVKKETQSEKELYKDYYYRNVLLKYTDKKEKKVEVTYFQMNDNEKKKLGKPLALKFKKKVPTQKLISDLKNSKKYAIWINEKVVSNSVLDNYNNTDFSSFFVSFVHKNARSKRFPQEYQAHLTTNTFFKTRNKKRVKDFEDYKLKRKKDPNYRGLITSQKTIYIGNSYKKPQIIEIQEGISMAEMKEYKTILKKVKSSKLVKENKSKWMLKTYKRMSSKQQKSVGNLYKYIPENLFAKKTKPQVREIRLKNPPKIDLVYTYKRLAKRIQKTSKNRKANITYLKQLYYEMNASQKKKVIKPSNIPVKIEVVEKKEKTKQPPKPQIREIEEKEIIEELEVVEEVVEQTELRELKEGVEEEEIEVVEEVEPVLIEEIIESPEDVEVIELLENKKEQEIITIDQIDKLTNQEIIDLSKQNEQSNLKTIYYINNKKISKKRFKRLKVNKIKKISIKKGKINHIYITLKK